MLPHENNETTPRWIIIINVTNALFDAQFKKRQFVRIGMNNELKKQFQHIPPVERAHQLIEIAFRTAQNKGKNTRIDARTNFDYTQQIDTIKIETAVNIVIERLKKIEQSFPNHEYLPTFYKELMSITLDLDKYANARNKIQHTRERCEKLQVIAAKRFETTRDAKTLENRKRVLFGRLSSLIKRAENTLIFLDDARKIMRGYPSIKNLPTAAIAGFPNVGKTTLLCNLSTAQAEIAEYAFTTKSINSGFIAIGSQEIQLLDTPGTLARPDKMNPVEKQAYCAIRHCADVIIYVIDPMESYPLVKQEILLELVKKENKKIILYMSKSDIASKEQMDIVKHMHPDVVTDLEVLKEKLAKELRSVKIIVEEKE